MSDTMKITVEVEVPDKEDCADCPFLDDSDRYDNDGYKRYVDCNLFPNDRGFLTKENTVKKFPSCLAACQKATEQGTKHTMEENFQHFLSLSGLSNEPEETISKLLKAFEFNYEEES